MAMEQDQHSSQSGTQNSAARRSYKYSPLNSPDSIVSSSNDASPITPRTPQLNVALPQNEVSTKDIKSEDKEKQLEDDAYWAEEDEGYFGELDEDEDEDLEEIYRSVR